MPNRVAALVGLLMLANALPATVAAEEPPSTEESKNAAIRAKDLAAFQAYRSLAASQSYGVSDEDLQQMIGDHLGALEDRPPHAMPTATDLHATTDKRFQQINDSLLHKATQGLDPQGELHLEKRLRDYLDHHEQIRAQFRVRYDDYLTKEFPNALDRVGKRIRDSQDKKLREALVSYVSEGKLTAPRIEAAYRQAVVEELAKTVEREILESCDAKWKRTLLAGAFTSFDQNVRKSISSGSRQLQERLDAFKEPPKSITVAGITKELRSRVDSVRERQTKQALSDPLQGSYTEFALVDSRIQEAVRWHFDRAVGAAIQRLVDDLRSGGKQLPKEQKQAIALEIQHDLHAHHEAVSSVKLLSGKIDELMAADRQWISAAVKSAVETGHSPFDTRFSQQDQQAVDQLVDKPKGVTNERWQGLKSLLLERYYKLALDARSDIVDEQAQQFAPGLVSHAWRPLEREIIDNADQRMQPAQLRQLPVWNGRPPGDQDVLEETWNLWCGAATTALRMGHDAMSAQKDVVDRLRDQVSERMRSSQGRAADDWTSEYSALVQHEWKSDKQPLAADYPQVFRATRQRIHEVVVELLALVAREKNAEGNKQDQPAETATVAKDIELDRKPKVSQETPPAAEATPPDTSRTASGDSPAKGDDHADGGSLANVSGKQQGQDTASDKKGSSDGEDQKKSATESLIVPSTAGHGGDGSPWASHAEYAALERQVELIEENYLGLNGQESLSARIKADPNPGWTAYCQLFTNRVTTQWQDSESPDIRSLRERYPKLLPVARQLIAGLVAEAMGGLHRPGGSGTGGYGDGDDPDGLYYRVYPIGFWGMCFLSVVIAASWYWNIKYLRAYYSARLAATVNDRQPSANLYRVLGARRPE